MLRHYAYPAGPRFAVAVPWLGSAERGGGGMDGVAQGDTNPVSTSTLRDGMLERAAAGNALRAAHRAEKYCFGLRGGGCLLSARKRWWRYLALACWGRGMSLGVSVRAGDGLKECEYFKGKRFNQRQKNLSQRRGCEPAPPCSAVCHQFSPLVLNIMFPIMKYC